MIVHVLAVIDTTKSRDERKFQVEVHSDRRKAHVSARDLIRKALKGTTDDGMHSVFARLDQLHENGWCNIRTGMRMEWHEKGVMV